MAEYVLGMDIGGTNIVAAVVRSADAQVVTRQSIPTLAERGMEDGLRRIQDLVQRLVDESRISWTQISGIGIGSTGPVDCVRGRIQNPYTLPTWDDVPIVDYLQAAFQRPAMLLNDGHVAALGEFWAGAGRGTRHMIYVTVGTGIGGGFVLDGKLYRGIQFFSGEIGHTVIDLNGPPCYCGARGCWEMFAAAPAITRLAQERVPLGSPLMQLAENNPDNLTPRLLSQAAELGDLLAKDILEQVGYYLGIGVGNLINIFAPEVIVLGGGVMQGWDYLTPKLFATLNSRKAMVPFDEVRIVPAQMGMNAGVLGAAYSILTALEG
jgi:glucokinase